MKQTFNPCDECGYSYSKQNQESGMCKICEFKELINLEKQNRLLKIPCVVGDTLYCDGKYFAAHCAGEIKSFRVDDIVTEVRSYFHGEVDYCFSFNDFDKTVFLTREEAEATLKELGESK